MRSVELFRRRAIVPTLGVVVGVTAAVATMSWSTAAARDAGSKPGAVFDATHLPPLLTRAGEIIDLAYDVHCVPPGEESVESGCEIRGTAFVRALGGDSFTPLPLEERLRNGLRQLAVAVPGELASEPGVEYFAVLESEEIGGRIVLPAGGAEAPHVSRPLGDTIEIRLGRHAFADAPRVGARVASARWGVGPGQVGLEQGRSIDPIGASAFDVDSRRNVLLLDQAHRRVLRWRSGAQAPEQVTVSVNGTLADLAAADDGSMFVLESTAPGGRNPLARRFDDGGRELEAIQTAERSSQIRIDAYGPAVLGGASSQWLPLVVHGVPATLREQLDRGRDGRRFRGGVELVVLRHENEIRVALVSGVVVVRSWRVTSDTPLAEVQLAEPLGQRVVLVVRAYEDGLGDQFLVLILGRRGLVDRFAVGSLEWAEAAPLGRFRLVGNSLYRLGSTSEAAFVDEFDLEVR